MEQSLSLVRLCPVLVSLLWFVSRPQTDHGRTQRRFDVAFTFFEFSTKLWFRLFALPRPSAPR